MMTQLAYLIVNFGGPRSLAEIEPFLKELLTDPDVIRTRWPQFFQNYLFRRIAVKRAQQIKPEYVKIGGSSPIWSDTEWVADNLRKKLGAAVVTFHRYLPETHSTFLKQMRQLDCEKVIVFPMFPQFSYATTGSIARFFLEHLPPPLLNKLRWIKSYPTHPAYLRSFASIIQDYLSQAKLKEEEVFFLFSAHGLPQSFINQGDFYNDECRFSFERLLGKFPQAEGVLCYQSKFGPGEWLRPYTNELCLEIEQYSKGRKQCVFVPLSFTSDHIETLFEVEHQYLPLIKRQGFHSFRVPAFNRRLDWLDAIIQIIEDSPLCSTAMLCRHPSPISPRA